MWKWIRKELNDFEQGVIIGTSTTDTSISEMTTRRIFSPNSILDILKKAVEKNLEVIKIVLVEKSWWDRNGE